MRVVCRREYLLCRLPVVDHTVTSYRIAALDCRFQHRGPPNPQDSTTHTTAPCADPLERRVRVHPVVRVIPLGGLRGP